MSFIEQFVLGIKKQETWYQRSLYKIAINMRYIRLPFSEYWGAVFFYERAVRINLWRRLKQIFYYDPMFRYRSTKVGKGLCIESKIPLISGYGSLYIGDNFRVSKEVNLTIGYKVNDNPTIIIGDDVYLGTGSILSCAERITIGNRVLIADGVHIYDNNNHPLDPVARGKNLPVESYNVKPVIVEDDVWIGARAVILKGVLIGQGAVVATCSVVTRDVPSMTVVAGNPAKVVKHIETA